MFLDTYSQLLVFQRFELGEKFRLRGVCTQWRSILEIILSRLTKRLAICTVKDHPKSYYCTDDCPGSSSHAVSTRDFMLLDRVTVEDKLQTVKDTFKSYFKSINVLVIDRLMTVKILQSCIPEEIYLRLTRLKLVYNGSYLTDENFSYLFQRTKSLKCLDLCHHGQSHDDQFTGSFLKDLPHGLVKLKMVCVNHVNELSNTLEFLIQSPAAATLQNLATEVLDNTHVELIGRHLTGLTTLVLWCSVVVTEVRPLSSLIRLKNLAMRQFPLGENRALAEGLVQIANSCHELVTLEIAMQDDVSPDLLRAISQNLKFLRLLSLKNFIRNLPVTDYQNCATYLKNMESLQILQLNIGELPQVCVEEIVRGCINLEKVYLNKPIWRSPENLTVAMVRALRGKNGGTDLKVHINNWTSFPLFQHPRERFLG